MNPLPSILAACCLSIVMSSVTRAQQAGNRLVITNQGPVGAVRELRFSSDSKHLYAAGVDKQVHVWALDRPGDGSFAPRHVQYVRWEVNRAERGSIYAMDISRNDNLAFAGYSARGDAGDIVGFDTLQRIQKFVFPSTWPKDHDQEATGHRKAIISLSFSPEGNRLVSTGLDGQMRIWSKGQNGISSIVIPRDTISSDIQTAQFLTEDLIAYAIPPKPNRSPVAPKTARRDGDWQLGVWNVSQRRLERRIERPVHQMGITSIATDDFEQGRWATADGHGNIFVWKTVKGRTPDVIDLWSLGFSEARDMHFAPNNQLIVSTAVYQDGESSRPASLLLLDLNKQPISVAEKIVLSKSEHGYTCEVSPDGKLVAAYAADDATEIWLFPLDRGPGSGKVLSAKNRVALHGHGKRFFRAAFSKSDPHSIAISSTPDRKFDLGFDFSKSQLLKPPNIPQSLDGQLNHPWRLVPSTDGSRHEWTLVHSQDGAKRVISLDPKYQGPMACYCWLHDENQKVYGIAIGTAKQNGIFAYSFGHFDPASGRCRLLRYFRDHRDQVHSLSTSQDGKYLLSSSSDQTIKVWSLNGLQEVNPRFTNATAWGAEFHSEGNRATVMNVDENGIVSQNGLENGDKIKQIGYLESGSEFNLSSPKEIVERLSSSELWLPVEFTIDGTEKSKEFIPGWQPLLTLLITDDNQWAVWTPQGYYDASVTGDEFFGWVHNRGRDKSPGFYRAAHMRPDLERPKVIQNLLSAGKLSAAFDIADISRPDLYQDPLPNLLALAPRIRILRPTNGENYKDDDLISVEAEVIFAHSDDLKKFRIKAFVNQNSAIMEKPVRNAENNSYRFTFDVQPVDAQSIVQVKIFRLGTTNDSHVSHDDRVQVDVKIRPSKLNIHYVGIGGSDYGGNLINLSGNNDVTQFRNQLDLLQESSMYEIGYKQLLLNKEVTPASINDLARKLKQETIVAPNDLLIVFIAGHGEAPTNDDFHFLTATGEKPERIPGSSLLGLADLNCRRLVIVDTCASGAILDDKPGEPSLKHLIRECKNENVAVWCAVQSDQQALGIDGMGDFTRVLIDAIRGKADRGDGFVTLQETKDYVENHNWGNFRRPVLHNPEGADSLLDLQLFKKH